MRVSDTDRRQAFVHVAELRTDIMIDSVDALNQVLDGDTIVVELKPPTRWQE